MGLTWTAKHEDGTVEKHKGEWIFSYILEGNAVQDIFILPSRDTRDTDSFSEAEYGTTLRLPLKDGTGRWQIIYMADLGRPYDRLIAEEVDGDIIQSGINQNSDDTTIWRWNFRNIKENSFHWEAVESSDQGKTWKTWCDIEAVRRK